jgi:hypothetical protein
VFFRSLPGDSAPCAGGCRPAAELRINSETERQLRGSHLSSCDVRFGQASVGSGCGPAGGDAQETRRLTRIAAAEDFHRRLFGRHRNAELERRGFAGQEPGSTAAEAADLPAAVSSGGCGGRTGAPVYPGVVGVASSTCDVQA